MPTANPDVDTRPGNPTVTADPMLTTVSAASEDDLSVAAADAADTSPVELGGPETIPRTQDFLTPPPTLRRFGAPTASPPASTDDSPGIRRLSEELRLAELFDTVLGFVVDFPGLSNDLVSIARRVSTLRSALLSQDFETLEDIHFLHPDDVPAVAQECDFASADEMLYDFIVFRRVSWWDDTSNNPRPAVESDPAWLRLPARMYRKVLSTLGRDARDALYSSLDGDELPVEESVAPRAVPPATPAPIQRPSFGRLPFYGAPLTPGPIDVSQMSDISMLHNSQFARGIRRDPTKYISFVGGVEKWPKVRDSWENRLGTEGLLLYTEKTFVPPQPGTMDHQEYILATNYIYAALRDACDNNTSATLVTDRFKQTKDGFAMLKALKDHFGHNDNRISELSAVKFKLANMKFHSAYRGGIRQYCDNYLKQMQRLSELTKQPLNDEEHIASFIATGLEDNTFRNITVMLRKDQQKEGVTMLDYITQFKGAVPENPFLKQRMPRRNNSTQGRGRGRGRAGCGRGRVGRGRGGRGRGRGRYSDAWKQNLTAFVPAHALAAMDDSESQRRNTARTAAGYGPLPTRQVSQTEAAPSTNETHVSSGGASDDISTSAPSIRTILQSQARVPASINKTGSMCLQTGDYTAPDGTTFRISMSRRVKINEMAVRFGDSHGLVDGGANQTLAGANMRSMDTNVVFDRCDIILAGETYNPDMLNLPVGTYCAVLTTKRNQRVLGVFPHTIGYGKGPSVLSTHQMREHGIRVDEIFHRHGGSQSIYHPENRRFGLKVRHALPYLQMEYPTDEEMTSLPQVLMTGEDWDPNVLDDNDDDNENDHFFDANDSFDMDDDAFYESRGDIFDDDMMEPPEDDHEDFVAYVEMCRSAARFLSPLDASGTVSNDFDEKDNDASDPEPPTSDDATLPVRNVSGRSAKQPRDWEALRRYFGWKPTKVLKDTFAATTQWAVNVLRLPMRQHFKSRFPALRVRRLDEDYSTDTYFANRPAHDGSMCAQLYVGKQSNFTKIYGMKTESSFPTTFLDFIRRYGAMKGLRSDNAKTQIQEAIRDIQRNYRIDDWQSAPYQQHQNPAERRIQEVKAFTTMILDRTGAPGWTWLLCMHYAVDILNHLAYASLEGRAPIEVAFGETPDISKFLTLTFWDEVLYLDPEARFPDTKEKRARFVGFAETVGDALTSILYTEDTNELIYRTVVRPADDETNPNRRSSSPASSHGEDSEGNKGDVKVELTSLRDEVMMETGTDDIPAPTIDPETIVGRTFLRNYGEDPDEVHRVEVIRRAHDLEEAIHSDIGQYVIRYQRDGRDIEDIATYTEVIEGINRQLQQEHEHGDDAMWSYKAILKHRKVGNVWEILVLWEDDSQTWTLLSSLARDDPVTLAEYAYAHDLLDVPGWKRFRTYAKNMKKLKRIVKQTRIQSMRNAPQILYGVKIPRNYYEALQFDRDNGNTLWADATKTEMDQIYEYKTVRSVGHGHSAPNGYDKIRCHLVYTCKADGRRKARLVASGHLAPNRNDSYYSSVVSFRGMRMVMFIAELNGLKLEAGDVGNAYLESYAREKCCFVAGPEFKAYGHEGHMMLIDKALYGMETSGISYHNLFAQVMLSMGFWPSKADSDIWMRDKDDHYEYLCVYVDDYLYAGKDPDGFHESLRTLNFKLKGCGEPKYHLGGDFGRVKYSDGKTYLTWGARTYITKRMMATYKTLCGGPHPKTKQHKPSRSQIST